MRSYKIVETNLRNRFSFPPQNFSQVRERYIFLNFQNFRESRSVKIANGKITLCAESGKAITFVCNWENGRSLCFARRAWKALRSVATVTGYAVPGEKILTRCAWKALRHRTGLNISTGVLPSRQNFINSCFRALRTRLPSLRSVLPSRQSSFTPYSIRRNRKTRKSRNSAFSHVKRRRFCIFAKTI